MNKSQYLSMKALSGQFLNSNFDLRRFSRLQVPFPAIICRVPHHRMANMRQVQDKDAKLQARLKGSQSH